MKKQKKSLPTKKPTISSTKPLEAPVQTAPTHVSEVTGNPLDELKKLEAQSVIPGPKAPGEQRADGTPGDTRKRKKFKRPAPEHTIRMTIRQYWRLRDWMARRQLGLPGDYAGIFIQKPEALVEPLVEPVVACLDEYLPEEWVVFIEDKSPVITLVIALLETEQIFQTAVQAAAKEIKQEPKKTDAPREAERIRYPGKD